MNADIVAVGVCRTNTSSDDNHTDHDHHRHEGQSHSDQTEASGVKQALEGLLPTREMLQQVHPGVAAAADTLLGQRADNHTGNATGNEKVDFQEKLPKQDTKPSGAGSETASGDEAQGTAPDIPWPQVAGLLHSQGITDSKGLVTPSCCTACLHFKTLCMQPDELGCGQLGVGSCGNCEGWIAFFPSLDRD